MISLPMNSAIVLNSIVVFLFLFFVITGYSRGLIHQLLDLVGLLAGFILAWLLSPIMADVAPIVGTGWDVFNQPIIGELLYKLSNTIVWFLVILAIVSLVISLVLKPFMKFIHKVPIARTVNRLLGGIYGLLPATVWSVLLALVLTTPIFANGRSTVEAAWFLKPFVKISDIALDSIYNTLDATGIIKKMATNEDLSANDIETAPEWLSNLGLSEGLTNGLAKLIRGDGLDPEDIQAIQSYIDDKKITENQVRAFLEQFGVAKEKAEEAIQNFQYQ